MIVHNFRLHLKKPASTFIVWTLLNLFKIDESDQLLAQTNIGVAAFDRLVLSMPDIIPQELSQLRTNQRRFSEKLARHAKFNDPQIWYLARKSSTKPCRCSGCLLPRKILPGQLHFYVNGLLHVEKNDQVVETKLRFCLSRNCVTNICSRLNNVKSLTSDCLIFKDSSLNGLTPHELETIKDTALQIDDLENIPLLSF